MAVLEGKVFIPDEGTDRVHVPGPAAAGPVANTGPMLVATVGIKNVSPRLPPAP